MPTVAIVGAGAAGLVAAKVLLLDGFEVTVFDQNKTLGGTWSFEGSYYNLHSQQAGGTMEFADLYDGEEYASWEHTYEYLCRYAEKFDLIPRVRLRTRVLSISKVNLHDAGEGWSVRVERRTETSSAIETLRFDFALVASGIFSRSQIPLFPGQERFAGSVLHANDVKSREQLLDKKILVVGGSKSAIDMATVAATITGSCEMIFRRIHIIIPVRMLRRWLSIRYLFCRFHSFLLDPYPLAPHGSLFHFVHHHFANLIAFIRKQLAIDLMISNGPDLYENDIFRPLSSAKEGLVAFPVQPTFAELKRQNRIRGHIGWIEEIVDAHTVRLNTGRIFSPVDLIVCSTGHQLSFPFLADDDARAMGLPHASSTEFELYRHMIPVGVPKIAFLGYLVSSAAWMMDEVAAHWVSDYFRGVLALPSDEEMHKEIGVFRDFLFSRFSISGPRIRFYWLEQMEIYLKDMGLPLRRTNNWWSENFGIYRPRRLKSLHEERRLRDAGLPFPSRFYFSFGQFLLLVCAVLFGICSFVWRE